MKVIVLFIYSFIVFVSCTDSNKSEKKSNDSNLLILDLDQAPMKDTIYASTFIASVTPIALETTDTNLIGWISDMQVTKDCICILDDGPGGSKNLYVFDKSGKFVRSIGQKGQGPGEYVNIRDFTIDEAKDEIFLVDDESYKIWVYRLSTGEFIRGLDFKDDQVAYRNIQCINNKLFIDFTFYGLEAKGPMVYALNETTGDIESKYLDVDIHNHGWLKPFTKGENFFYCKNSSEPKFIQSFMDTLMMVKAGGLEPYLVIRSKDWVTGDDVRKNENTTHDPDNDFYIKIRELPIAHNVRNYVESENYICFIYDKKNDNVITIYDKKNSDLLQTKNLVDDVMFVGDRIQIYSIDCGDENGMYCCINTPVMPYFYGYTLGENSSMLKPEYKKFLEGKITPDSNPVLLYYEYKK